MRKYVTIFDKEKNLYRIAFRDPDDPADTYYMETSFSGSSNDDFVNRVVSSLNHNESANVFGI